MAVASLPMYDLPEVHGALDALWAGIARELRRAGLAEAPARLVRDRGVHELWRDPALLLSQCCGYDVMNGFAGTLRPVATPRYDAPGCAGVEYASAVVVRADCPAARLEALRGAVCVINGLESHSGMNALRALVAPLAREGRFFSDVRVSGAHLASLAAVARGEADVAAIDCVTYGLVARHRPAALAGTRVLCYTERAPGIPYVTRADAPEARVERLRSALAATFEAADLAAARDDLLLAGLEIVPLAAYERLAELERRAKRFGYPALR